MRAPLVTLVVIVLSRGAASAAPAADLVVAWGPEPLGRLGDAIQDAASRAGAAYVDTSPGATPLPDPRPAIKRGIQAYGALEFEAAVSALDAAAELVDQTGASQVDTATLSDLFLYRALAHAQRADDTRSWEDLVVAATIDPTRTLDPAAFPPRVVDRFRQARAHVGALPRATLTLTGGPGCRVRVDGAPLRLAEPGTTATELELPFGRHWIDATCDGRAPVRRRLAVDRTTLEVALAGAPIVPPSDDALAIQARTAAARAFVAVTLQGGNAVVRRLAADGKEQDRTTVRLGGPRDGAAVAAAVGRLLAPPEVIVQRPWYRSRWVWAAAGAVAASAILVPLAATRGGETLEPVVRFDPPW